MLRTVLISFLLSFFIPFSLRADLAHPLEEQADKTIDQIYHILPSSQTVDMQQRIIFISGRLVGKPYILTALGDGLQSRFDQGPLYRMDAFDCQTYVDTVVAIALAADLTSFKQCIRRIRYTKGNVDFITRNHFTCLDWNQSNRREGYIQDITMQIHDETHRPVAKMAQAIIDKPGWYQHFTPQIIRLNTPDPQLTPVHFNQLKQLGNSLPVTTSSIPYLPLDVLFDKAGQANDFLFAQIPNGSIIEIIRPNWDLVDKIGTHLNVSHLGFALWNHGILYYREASSAENRVVDVPLVAYLRNARTSPTVKGINVQIILPQMPLNQSCLAPSPQSPQPTTQARNLRKELKYISKQKQIVQ